MKKTYCNKGQYDDLLRKIETQRLEKLASQEQKGEIPTKIVKKRGRPRKDPLTPATPKRLQIRRNAKTPQSKAKVAALVEKVEQALIDLEYVKRLNKEIQRLQVLMSVTKKRIRKLQEEKHNVTGGPHHHHAITKLCTTLLTK